MKNHILLNNLKKWFQFCIKLKLSREKTENVYYLRNNMNTWPFFQMFESIVSVAIHMKTLFKYFS